MSDLDTLVQASRLYYELGETQEQIARTLGMTRPQVSRLLKEARAQGIVEIRVIDTASHATVLAERLRERFGLREVRLAPRLAGPSDNVRRLIGRHAAELIRDIVRDGVIVGVGDGAAVGATADALTDLPVRTGVTIVPLSGGGMTAPSRDPVRRLAESFGGLALELFAPGIVHDPAVRDALMNHVGNDQVARMWEALDVAVFGVGTYLRSQEWFGADILRELDEAGAVGEILIAPFDIEGSFVSERLRRVVIGFDARELARVPVTIAVAGGRDKVTAILGALRTGAVKVLVTDEETASGILDLADASPGADRS